MAQRAPQDPVAAVAKVPAPVRAATEAVFAGLARLRDARPFHPRGASFSAELRPLPGSPLAFLGTEPRSALVRLSNAVGLPAWSPDLLGLAVRVPRGAGGRDPQDLLVTSSHRPPLARHVPSPAAGFDRTSYSSMLCYRHDGRLLLVGARYSGPPQPRPLPLAGLARAALDGELTFTLEACAPFGAWRPAAELRVLERLTATESRQLRFNPWNSASQLRPVGPLNHLRAPAYEAAHRTATSE